MEVVTREAVRILDEVAGAVAAALGEAAVDDETARGVVPLAVSYTHLTLPTIYSV